MSNSMLLAILSIGEIAIVTTGVAIFLLFRYKKIKQTNLELVNAANNVTVPEAEAPPSLYDLIDERIEQTNSKLQDIPEEKAKLLELRKAYLETEKAALIDDESNEAYWDNICERISDFPSAQEINAEDTLGPEELEIDNEPVLNELDDIDVSDPHDDIPILEDAVGQQVGDIKKDPSLTIESANEDLERLRNIIARQHQSMDDLKAALANKDIDLDQNQELAKKLEEVDVAQAQLNMCIETLEKENERLNEMLTDQDSVAGTQELSDTKVQLEEANERISNLERENSLQAERIEVLENEIAGLEKQLEERNSQLERIQAAESDLSQTDDAESVENTSPDSLLKEIEDLTDLITRKSEELSELQNQQTDDFSDLTDEEDFPEMTLDDELDQAPPEKAAG